MNEYEEILGIKIPNNTNIKAVTNSSKKVLKDSIFFGLQGTNVHGSNYAEDAIENGASLVVHDDPMYDKNNERIIFSKELKKNIVKFLDSFYSIEINSNNFFTFTGTNGKSSTAYICHQLLCNFGYESLYIGTLGAQHNQKKIQTKFSNKTTPDLFELYEIVSSLKWGLDSFSICIEVSSHALDQNRLNGINYLNSASILNIAEDHLDYHKNILSYRSSKFSIFKINSSLKLIDDESNNSVKNYDFIDETELTCISSKNNFSDISYMITKTNFKKTEFQIFLNNPPFGQEIHKNKKYKFTCSLFPEFNISNLVFAICSIGFDEFSDKYVNDLSFIKLPKGRVELIDNIPKNIIIDYAHNAHSFEVLLSSIKNYFENLILVFGFGGERDRSKRTKMLKIALKNSSKIFLTSDNSRSEVFKDILKDAFNGNNSDDLTIIEDRKEAIINANKVLDKSSCLLILGKGHEQTQEINGKIYHFSDHEVVDEIYR